MNPRACFLAASLCVAALPPSHAVVNRRPGPPPRFQQPQAAFFPQTDRQDMVNPSADTAALKAFQQTARRPFRAMWDNATGRIRTLYQGESRAYSGSPAEAARAFVKDAAGLLGPGADAPGLSVADTHPNAFGHQVVLQQTVRGVPILGRQITVNLSASGAVLTAENTTGPIPVVDTQPAVSALTVAGLTTGRVLQAPRLFVETNAPEPRLVWRTVTVEALDKVIRTTVDAHTGDVILRENIVESATGTGKVYLGNPVSTPTLTSQPLPWLDGGGTLTGTYAKAYNDQPPGVQTVNEPTLVYNYAANDARLAELQAYYGITAIHDYFKGNLGFTGRDQQMPAFVHIVGLDNAFFSSGIGSDGGMAFGFNSAGVEYALDSDVLYHEYTHAVIDKVSATFAGAYDYYHEPGGINEGLADYFSSSKLNDPVLAEYALAGGYERDLRARYHFPEDLQLLNYDSFTGRYYQDFPEVHHTGEIWGPACWDLRQSIGQTAADAIIFKAISLFGATTRMQDALGFLLTTDTQLNGGANAAAIQAAYNGRGIYATTYGVSYLNPDQFYSTVVGASKVKTGWVFEDASGAYYQDMGLFPAIVADRWYSLQGYTEDSTIKSVFVVLKSTTGAMLGYSGNDTAAFYTTYRSISTWYKFPATLVTTGASRNCRIYIYSFTQTAATVTANFLGYTPKSIAPATGTVISAILLKVRKGDINTDGKVTMKDAIIALRWLRGTTWITHWEAPQADVVLPTTGQPDIEDVKQMMKIAAGLA